jgi:hypothetical protein
MVKNVAKVDEKRVAAAIKGALLADAASMGTHMIMDPEDVKKEVPSEEAPEFKDPPTPRGGYSAEEFPGHYGPGMLSPWGEQLLFATDYCGRHKCVTAGHMSVRMKEWAETFGGFQDDSIKEFLTCMKCLDRSVEVCCAEDERGKIGIAIRWSHAWRILKSFPIHIVHSPLLFKDHPCRLLVCRGD